MADDLTDDELEVLRKHRAAKAKSARKVKVRGKDDESGAEYEFDLEGDEAERVISRHSSLFEDREDSSAAKAPPKKGPYFKGAAKQ
jgi:hypothetical protein